MDSIFDTPPAAVRLDLEALGQALDAEIPAQSDDNVLIATWNLRRFGSLTREGKPTGSYSPKRDLPALRIIADLIARFDVIAIQEVTGDLRALRDMMKYLGDRRVGDDPVWKRHAADAVSDL